MACSRQAKTVLELPAFCNKKSVASLKAPGKLICDFAGFKINYRKKPQVLIVFMRF